MKKLSTILLCVLLCFTGCARPAIDSENTTLESTSESIIETTTKYLTSEDRFDYLVSQTDSYTDNEFTALHSQLHQTLLDYKEVHPFDMFYSDQDYSWDNIDSFLCYFIPSQQIYLFCDKNMSLTPDSPWRFMLHSNYADSQQWFQDTFDPDDQIDFLCTDNELWGEPCFDYDEDNLAAFLDFLVSLQEYEKEHPGYVTLTASIDGLRLNIAYLDENDELSHFFAHITPDERFQLCSWGVDDADLDWFQNTFSDSIPLDETVVFTKEERIYLADYEYDESIPVSDQEMSAEAGSLFKITSEQDSYPVSTPSIRFHIENLQQTDRSVGFYQFQYKKDGVWRSIPGRYPHYGAGDLLMLKYIPAEGRDYVLDLTERAVLCPGEYRFCIPTDDRSKLFAVFEFTLTE